MSVRIMLADDHILVREGIKCLLECDRNVEVIAEADDGLECLQKLEFTVSQCRRRHCIQTFR